MDSNTSRSFAAVVVAAGKGVRTGQSTPKQFVEWRGKPLVRHSVEALLNYGASKVAVAIPAGYEEMAAECLTGLAQTQLVQGGASRQESVHAALKALGPAADHVLIHDAARPDIPEHVVDGLLAALSHNPGAIPVLPIVDSVIHACEDTMQGPARRDELRRVQTPQAFRFGDILAAHEAWTGDTDAGDDAQVLVARGATVSLVPGDERLHKFTFAEDFMQADKSIQMSPARTGIGYDVHRLARGEELWLCGIRLKHDQGLAGHSDADVALHAVVDAILGAACAGDIGDHFPPSDPQWRGAPSSRFVEHAVSLAEARGLAVSHVDLTIICEAPRIGPHKDAMAKRLAHLLGIDIGMVNVKATTTERLGFTGRGEGIAAQAVATLVPTS